MTTLPIRNQEVAYFLTTGTFYWTVPEGVYSLNLVYAGGSGGGGGGGGRYAAGATGASGNFTFITYNGTPIASGSGGAGGAGGAGVGGAAARPGGDGQPRPSRIPFVDIGTTNAKEIAGSYGVAPGTIGLPYFNLGGPYITGGTGAAGGDGGCHTNPPQITLNVSPGDVFRFDIGAGGSGGNGGNGANGGTGGAYGMSGTGKPAQNVEAGGGGGAGMDGFVMVVYKY